MRKAKFTKPLSVTVTEEVYQRIKIFTNNEGISMSELVRAIIDKELPKVLADPLNWGCEEGDSAPEK
jgi:hypothetical protein